MALSYVQWVQSLTILAQQASAYLVPPYGLQNAPDFQNMLPRFLEYAEGRIYRECPFLAQRTQDQSRICIPNNRQVNLSVSPVSGAITVLVVEGFAILYPFTGSSQQWMNFSEASLDTVDMLWPNYGAGVDPGTVTDRWWAMLNDHVIVMGPPPDQAYSVQVTGIIQPAPLSSANQSYLATTYPDVLLAASMVSVAGFLENYGSQSDDAQKAQSWESQYQTLKQSMIEEEQRRRGQGAGWSANVPTPIATPPRS